MRKTAVIFSSILAASNAFGVGSGGYTNQVPTARSMGRANSVSASIDDASAISFNTARLTAIKKLDVSIGAAFPNLATDYSSSNGSGDQDTLESNSAISPNFHLAARLPWERLVAGIGVTVPYGLTTEWDKQSPLRYIATKSELAILSISPAVAFQVTDSFSVGVGLDYYTISKAKFDRQVNVSGLNFQLGGTGGEPDGTQSLEGDGDDLGANIGLAFSPAERHLLGISYRSGANIDVDGSLKLSGLSNESAGLFGGETYETSAETKILVPPELQMGYAFKATPRLIIEVDAQWNEWGRYRDQNLRFAETDPFRLGVLNSDNPTRKDWRNSWSVGIGLELNVTENIAGRAGYGFLDSPVPGSSFEASTPDADLHVLTLGFGFTKNAWGIDLGGQYFMLNDRKIENNVGASSGSTGNGSYDSEALYLAMSVSYRR